MKKNIIFITSILCTCILQADSIQDLENAIKEGNHAKVVELHSTLTVSQEDFNRLEKCANSKLASRKEDISITSLTSIKLTLSTLGIIVGCFFSGTWAYGTWDSIQKNEKSEAAFFGLLLEPISIAGTVGSAILSYKYGKQTEENEKQYHEASKIASIIKALKIRYEQSDQAPQINK